MSEMAWIEIGLAVFGAVASVIWFFIRQADTRQNKDIEKLFNLAEGAASKAQIDKAFERYDTLEASTATKADAVRLFKLHDEDAAALAEVKLTLAEQHPKRPELDNRFSKLSEEIKDGFKSVKDEIKEMTVYMQSIHNENMQARLKDRQ